MDIKIVPPPDHIKKLNPEPVPEPSSNPGWWKLVDLIGSRPGVLKKVAENPAIPEHWKVCIKADIDSLDTNLNHIELDAHYHVQGGRRNFHYTLSASPVL